MSGRVIHADNLKVLASLPDASVQLIYIDPPFNTGKVQKRRTLRTVRDASGDRVGFKGARYRTEGGVARAYSDSFDDYAAFLEPRLTEAWRLLKPEGSLYVHLDYREAHYVKLQLDRIFGRECFLNEIIWAYDYGARAKTRWPAKHDTIFFYCKDPKRYFFSQADVDREPYMAPGLVGPEKAARGKLPTDVWWHTIVPTSGKEKTGYPTQKPLGILRRIVNASSKPGDLVLDFFAGSGTTGAVCLELGREFVLVDSNPQAIAVMRKRFAGSGVKFGKLPRSR